MAMWIQGFILLLLYCPFSLSKIIRQSTTEYQVCPRDNVLVIENYLEMERDELYEWVYLKSGYSHFLSMNLTVYLPPNNNCSINFVWIDIDNVRQEQICDSTIFSSDFESNKIAIYLVVSNNTHAGRAGYIGEVYSAVFNYNGIVNRPMPRYRNLKVPIQDSTEHGDKNLPGAVETTCDCGVANRESERVVGGKPVLENEYPFLAKMMVRDNSSSPYLFFCGAVIITKRHVLTAAHCVSDVLSYNKEIAILVGQHGTVEESKWNASYVYPVKEIHAHENFTHNDIMILNDITVLLLDREMVYSDIVGPACLPQPSLTNLTGEVVRLIGWGSIGFKEEGTDIPNDLDMLMLDPLVCAYTEIPFDYWDLSQICTYNAFKGTCSGDSGGPLIWLDPETNRYTVVGLVSGGGGCNLANLPSFQTNVTFYLPWIYDKIAATDPSNKACTKK